MSSSLTEIAQTLKSSNKKVQLIYAFNGTGKTRLSREFKSLINSSTEYIEEEETEIRNRKILYYNAFTEDLFYWDNDLQNDSEPKLKIHPNDFTNWIFVDQGQDQNIIKNFQHYTNEKLTPNFNEKYTIRDKDNKEKIVEAFTEVTFSYERGNEEYSHNIKISKGEESNFVWSVFYSLLEQVVEVLNVPDPNDRETNQFDKLEYVFIDDPVSSLDDNHLIELAVNLAELIKNNQSNVKFILTTHSPLFYNILYNELNRNNKEYYKSKRDFSKYRFDKLDDGTYLLEEQPSDSPFSYHLYLKKEIEKAIKTEQIKKYHFNFLRNILEKTATFLGYKDWVELLPTTNDGSRWAYEKRIVNSSSHSKHSGDEIAELSDDDKRVLIGLMKNINENYRFK